MPEDFLGQATLTLLFVGFVVDVLFLASLIYKLRKR